MKKTLAFLLFGLCLWCILGCWEPQDEGPYYEPHYLDRVVSIELRTTPAPPIIDTLAESQVEIELTAIGRNSSGVGLKDQLITFRIDPVIGCIEPDSVITDSTGRAISRYQVTIPPDTTRVIIYSSCGQVESQKTVTLNGR